MWQINIRRDISAVEVTREELGVQASQQGPKPRVPILRKEFPQTSGCKTSRDWGWVRWRDSRVPGGPLKGITHGLTLTHSLWTPAPGQKLERQQGQEMKCLESGAGLGRQLSPREKNWKRPLFLWWTLLPQTQQVSIISESPSTWLSLSAWWFLETSPHPTCGPTEAGSRCHVRTQWEGAIWKPG